MLFFPLRYVWYLIYHTAPLHRNQPFVPLQIKRCEGMRDMHLSNRPATGDDGSQAFVMIILILGVMYC